MNTITSVYIKGLWGHQDINILLNGKTNFIIGVNGTGKTTLINLLAAALTFDYEKLLRIEFESIIIRLKEIGGSRRPSIRVTKDVLSSDDSLIYEIKTAAKEQPIIIPFDARFDRVYIETKDGGRVVSRRRTSNQEAHGLNEISIVLKDLIKVSWLSVNRADNLYSRDIDKRALSTIDHKIIELNNNLVRYFSVLSQQFSDHTIEFQKKSFLALINNEGANPIFQFSSTIDIDQERKTLVEVFDVLGVDNKHYLKKLNEHFSRLEKVKKRDNLKSISVDDFSVIYNSWRAHTLVADYEILQTKKSSIFKSRDNFISLLNSMFNGRKKFSVSDKNELVVTTKDGRLIGLEELSSGEKQLLIILGETLLQHSQHVIYIADEPELSLHVIWQEQLIGAITKLNPNAQIIFATHSPDIVGFEQDAVIDMEDLVS
ncbi:TPA: AAA family ATPase [Citrobacter freundii]|uniref:AAA family ATPase n=3 Tax=Enterobacteriaceae TaxID=543 RepID=A0A7T0GZH9_9ENTR|nr:MULTISPECIES: AAA family ATPase [Enterobacteriaceae]HAT1662912.1 AAA family ATPase [Raoultella ornithinolytica]HCR2175368.1 AAA family ATPase [Enterobacter roggenkampii]EKG3234637.1 AAA family ATPase [Enterobacter hormaechei]ELA5891115.1 AAA family ATPase [Escherichia coli]ELJ6210474.1 AAA family ATPase [Citrobacter freundii]